MDESAQQAVNLGVNVTIFIVALTISLSLMFAVRDLANNAYVFNETIPDGSVAVTTEDKDDVILSGFDVMSYYYNYVHPYVIGDDGEKIYNHSNIGTVIVNLNGDVLEKNIKSDNTLEIENDSLNLTSFKNKVNLTSKYSLSIKTHYDNTGDLSGTTVMYIEEIPIKQKSEIYSYYVSKVKPIFKESTSFFKDSKLIVKTNNDTIDSVDVADDSENSDKEFKNIINKLDGSLKYSIRIKRIKLQKNMKASNVILYIDKSE